MLFSMWSMILPNHLTKNCLRLVIRCLSRQSDMTITVEKRSRHSVISLWENPFHHIWFSKQKLMLIFTSLNRETITEFNSQKKKNQFLKLWQMRWDTKISQTFSFSLNVFFSIIVSSQQRDSDCSSHNIDTPCWSELFTTDWSLLYLLSFPQTNSFLHWFR